MKKAVIIVLITMIALSATLGVCLYQYNANRTAPETVYWAEMPENTNPNLKYFGYYHFGGDRIEEVAAFGHANIAKVDGDNEEEFLRLIDNGFYVFIMIRHMFFKDNGTQTDWSARWQKVKELIAPHIDRVLGFYVDEPVRRNFGSSENIGKSMESFHFACQMVREDYPDKRMMSVLTVDDLTYKAHSREYYKYCTDLGYDYYPKWNRNSVLGYIDILENDIAVSNQSIWLVPKAFYTVDTENDLYGFIEDRKLPIGKDVLDWIKGSYEIAVDDHRIAGIFCFVYDNGNFTIPMRKFFMKDSEYYNEEVYGVYNQIGRAVIARAG